jgi:predicted kinase
MRRKQPGILVFMCGKMAAGKSTLARRLAQERGAVLLPQDELLEALYPGEFVDFNAFIERSARLRAALTPHIVSLLGLGQCVVLDFPGNTRQARVWFRSLIDAARAEHELHYIDAPDALCRQQLEQRRLELGLPQGAKWTTSADFEEVTALFDAPKPDEGFNVIVHRRAG